MFARPDRNRQLLHNLVLFGRALRRLGLEVTPGHVLTLVDALEEIGIERRADFKAAARTVLVGRRDEIEVFDRAFDLFWRADAVKPRRRIDLGRMLAPKLLRREPQLLTLPGGEDGGTGPELDATLLELQRTYSPGEVLRHKDFAELSPEETRAVRRMLLDQPWRVALRRTRRKVPASKGKILDLRRTLRRSFRTGGEPVTLAWRRRREKPRPLVVLCDVSGSMEAYSRLFLQFLYALRGATDRLEAFVFGTRLTRITTELADRDVDRALRRATDRIRDWGGGTRIGESLKRFNYDWGRRVLGGGAVVAVLSDGWDRGDVALLERETARLKRSSSRLLWLNPLLGSPGYEPLTRGIRRILPHVDDFLPVHNLTSLEQLGKILGRLGAGR